MRAQVSKDIELAFAVLREGQYLGHHVIAV
jgi:hypothetical protein